MPLLPYGPWKWKFFFTPKFHININKQLDRKWLWGLWLIYLHYTVCIIDFFNTNDIFVILKIVHITNVWSRGLIFIDFWWIFFGSCWTWIISFLCFNSYIYLSLMREVMFAWFADINLLWQLHVMVNLRSTKRALESSLNSFLCFHIHKEIVVKNRASMTLNIYSSNHMLIQLNEKK